MPKEDYRQQSDGANRGLLTVKGANRGLLTVRVCQQRTTDSQMVPTEVTTGTRNSQSVPTED